MAQFRTGLLAAFLATGLFFLAMPGTAIGVGNLLLIALQQSPQAPPTAWIQAHGQAQIYGWVGSFALGIALCTLPRRATRLWTGWVAWLLWSGGITLRWLTGVGDLSAHPYLVASAGLEVAGLALCLSLLLAPPREGLGLGSVLGFAGFCGLGIALLLNLAGTLQAAPGTAVYPPELDARLVGLGVWTFMVPLAVASSAHLGARLGLGTPRRIRAAEVDKPLALMVVAMMVAILMGAAVATAILALGFAVTAVWGLRILEPGAPGGQATFVRIGYGWLLLGAQLAVAAPLLPGAPGLGGAARHALTVGFIATLIFALGPRALPEFLGRKGIFSPKLTGLSLGLLTAGCGLRVASEAGAYGTPGTGMWNWLPLSAYIELVAVLLFVANLGLTIAGLPKKKMTGASGAMHPIVR